MTQTTIEKSQGAPSTLPVSSGGGGSARKRHTVPILLQLLAMVGVGALVYPSAADWFATLHHNAEVSGYVDAVEQLPTETRLEKLRVAREYNAHMPQGVLRDPYSSNVSAENESDAAYAAYEQVLRVSDNGVIGELLYPRLNIGLPVYHGTSDEVISRGIGHLYGSSLPVGGPSTHSVLTAHSGLVHAALFTALPKAQLGDTFQITVLGETHHYRVDSIETVLPDDTGSLRITEGQDLVTLITCTPIGINSHRILVRGERVAAPETEGDGAIAGDGRTAGFPWWALGFIAGSSVIACILFAPSRPRRAKDRAAATGAGDGFAATGEEREVAR